MATTRDDLTPAMVRDQIAELIVTTIVEAAGAASIATTYRTDKRALTFPTVTDDVAATWVAEASELTLDDLGTGEVTITPAKVIAATRVSNESLEDTDPALDTILGASLARSIAAKVDAAVFGKVTGGVAPAGLGALTGFTPGGSTDLGNLDALVSATYAARSLGATPSAIVVAPATAERIALLKTAPSGTNAYLLTTTGQDEARLAVNGVPLVVNRFCDPAAAYVVDSRRLALVIRKDAATVVDGSVFALTRETLVLQEARVGFGVLHPASVVKVTVEPTV